MAGAFSDNLAAMRISRWVNAFTATILLAFGAAKAAHAEGKESKLWLANFDAREKYFEHTLGPLPRNIVKMHSMKDVWPGGGIYIIPATKLGPKLTAYTTSGLSNTDMPARIGKKQPAPRKRTAAGYGYEIIVITAPDQDWPLNLLPQMVTDEIRNDADLLADVDNYEGMAIEDIDVGAARPMDFLIARARPPLPTGVQLPGGSMAVLVATTITREERRWSMVHGRKALLDKLMEAGVGQVSKPGRDSVVK